MLNNLRLLVINVRRTVLFMVCKYFLFYMFKSCPEYLGDGLNFNNQRPAASLPIVYATSVFRAFSFFHLELISDFLSQGAHFPWQNLAQYLGCCVFIKDLKDFIKCWTYVKRTISINQSLIHYFNRHHVTYIIFLLFRDMNTKKITAKIYILRS